MYPVESEVKQQVANAQKYKNIIREEKDLTRLVGTESSFDVDAALRQMLAYYESWKGRDIQLIDRIGINDEEIIQYLRTEIMQDKTSQLMSVDIKNFPNEAGYFMLWELSISEEKVESALFRFSSMKTSCFVRWPESVSWMFSLMVPAV